MSKKVLISIFIASLLAIVGAQFLYNRGESTQDINADTQIVTPKSSTYHSNDNSKDEQLKLKYDQNKATQEAQLPWFQRFSKSFGYSFLIVFTAQVADKTFVVVIIFAMTYAKTQVFLGASLALIIMHSIAVLLGSIVPGLIPQSYIRVGSVIIFSLFGAYLIYKGYKKKNKSVEAKLKKVEKQLSVKKSGGKKGLWKLFLHSAFMKVFLLVLVSEMGDRSQITAVALGAANEVWGVILGGSFGHSMCSLFGVWLGLIFMNRISPGKLIMFGGIVCLIFALDILIFG